MISKSNFIFVGVTAIIVGVAGFLVYRQQKTENARAHYAVGSALCEKVELDQLQKITIESNKSITTLLKKNDQWGVLEREGYPADEKRLRGVIYRMQEAKVAEYVQCPEQALSTLNLNHPIPPLPDTSSPLYIPHFSEMPTKINFETLSGVATFMICGKMKLSNHTAAYEGQVLGRYYLRNSDQPSSQNIYNVPFCSETLEEVNAYPQLWIDKSFPTIENVLTIETVENSKNNVKFSRENTDSVFTVENYPNADSLYLTEKVNYLSVIKIEDVRSIAYYDQVVPKTELKITTADQRVYHFKIYELDGRFGWCALSIVSNDPIQDAAFEKHKHWVYRIQMDTFNMFLETKNWYKN